MNAGFRLVEHTADVGIEAFGSSLPEVFRCAAEGLLTLFCRPEQVGPQRSWPVAVKAQDLDHALVVFLEEILFFHETERVVFSRVEVGAVEQTGTDWHVNGLLHGEPVDPGRHEIHGHVKAVTLHGLEVRRQDSGWRARVIVDL